MNMSTINWGKVLSIIIIVLSASAGIGYLFQKDYRHAIYWIAAAVIAASVTF